MALALARSIERSGGYDLEIAARAYGYWLQSGPFDLGTVVGFVSRTGGALRAVSGVCTHLGCRLALDAPARALNCPWHRASFAIDGELLRYQLRVPPPALPQLEVRETDGAVQIFAPPGQA